MPQRNVATNFTFEQQRQEINLLAADFTTHESTVNTAAPTYLKHDGSNDFTGQTLAVPNAFTINANSGSGTVTISGNLNVSGTTTTVSSTNLEVTDKNILIAKGSTSDAQADGAGITIDSATDITFNFVDANDALVSSIGLEGTTFLKAPYGQFTGSGTPSAGQGIEINAPDTNTGQISSYDRGGSAYKELRLKGSSVGIYGGTANALVGSFSSTGLSVTGDITGTTNLTVGNASSIFAENNLRFKSAGAAYIDHNTTGQDINFRVSNSSSLDTTPLVVSSTGLNVTGTITASDDVTITGNKTLKIESSSTDDYVRIYAGGGTGKWDIYGNGANLRFSDNDSAGSVVFDRNVDANGGITGDLTGAASQVALGNDSSGTTVKRVLFSSADTGDVTIQADTSDGITYKPSDGTLSVQKLEGTVVTAAQSSITSLGTLTGLTVNGNLTITGGIVQNDDSSETAFGSKSLPAADSGYYVRNGNGGTGTYSSIGLIASSTGAASDQSASLIAKCTASGLSPEVYLTQRDGNNSQRSTIAINTLGDITIIGSLTPNADNGQNLGSSSKRWANVYTADAHFNNIGTGGNEVDGSEGHWTMQEGESDFFLINRRSGKKYKFMLQEVN